MGTTKKEDLAIITKEPFPIGMAATNRIISYSRIIARYKYVKVFIAKPTEDFNSQFNFQPKGNFEGIDYEYTYGNVIWPKSKSKSYKSLILFKGYLKLIIRIIQQKPKTVIIYTSSLSIRILSILLKFLLKYKLVIEENEYPKILNRTKNKFLRQIHLTPYKNCDGMLVMTNELANYYKSVQAKEVHILPMTVDISRFNNIEDNVNELNYFIYVGGGGGFKRDGVFDIVKGFSIFLKKYPEYKLLIIGPYNPTDDSIKTILRFISENNLSESIKLTGSKPTNIIPSYLFHAKGIVMAPPKDFESGGFPTKLGEFLMSGTPVITTAVSDIPKYLNNSNSYIVKTNSPEDIEKAMIQIVSDNKRAKIVGLKGKELAQIHFNAETYLDNLMAFLRV
jgi:glycosyltransferase involved in cell wall biosynthesis